MKKKKKAIHTQLTCLLGSPVAHSKSPLMHNESFAYWGLDMIYQAFDVTIDTLEASLTALRSMNVRGFNLTMPLKNEICKYCDELSPVSQITGSVNTVVNQNGIYKGYTTDGIGFMRALKEANCDIIGKKMVLLGTGGAATSIFVQAALDGVSEISIFNRRGKSYDRAVEIIEELKSHSDCKISLFDYSDENLLRKEIQESALLVNGTCVGMAPDTDVSLINDPFMFHKNLFVSDIIYNPLETKFLRLAKEAGCQTQNGLYMLLYQGAEAFKLWTGKEMPVEIVKEKYFS